jgi:hypothetical protein
MDSGYNLEWIEKLKAKTKREYCEKRGNKGI